MASSLGLSMLSGCGQKGNLYLPNDPDFQQRATLPEIVRRQFPDMPPPRAPGATPTNNAPANNTPATNTPSPGDTPSPSPSTR